MPACLPATLSAPPRGVISLLNLALCPNPLPGIRSPGGLRAAAAAVQLSFCRLPPAPLPARVRFPSPFGSASAQAPFLGAFPIAAAGNRSSLLRAVTEPSLSLKAPLFNTHAECFPQEQCVGCALSSRDAACTASPREGPASIVGTLPYEQSLNAVILAGTMSSLRRRGRGQFA